MTRATVVLFLCLAFVVKAGVAQAGDPEEARKAFFVGASMVDAGDHENAIPWLEQALDEDPGFCRAHFYLALCFAERGNDDGDALAIDEAERYERCATAGEAEDVERLWRLMPERSSSSPPPPPPPEDDGYGRSESRDDDEQTYGRSDSRDDDEEAFGRSDSRRDDEESYGRSDSRHDDDRDDRGRDGRADRREDDRSSSGGSKYDDDYRNRRYGRRDDDREERSSRKDKPRKDRSDDRGKSARDDRGKGKSDDRGKGKGETDEWGEEEDEFAYLLDLEEDDDGSTRSDDRRDDRDDGYRPSSGADVHVTKVPSWKKRKIAGGIIMGAGAGAAAGGFVLSAVMYRTYYWEEDTNIYNWARTNTIVGTAIGVVGAVTGITGFVVMVATRKDTYAAAVLPGPVTTFAIRF